MSVVIPVKDGERYLDQLLQSIADQNVAADVEALVVDSASSDYSVEIAKAGGAKVIEIDPEQFGHGRTREMAFEKASGQYVAFLTQDATPASSSWLQSMLDGFKLGDRVGAVYGPHLPRPDASPMIANELESFFQAMSPTGKPVLQSADGESELTSSTFLSNVNSCIARECWQQIHFRDVPYSEDQAFGSDLIAAGWQKVYNPEAAVLHSHSYPLIEFARRYFDEYRGLRDVSGHVEPFKLKATFGTIKRQVSSDRQYMKTHGFSKSRTTRWTVRSSIHHSLRRIFSALGSRSDKLPGPLRSLLSLESRSDR